MDEVDAREPEPPHEGGSDTEALDQRGRDREAEERQPEQAGEDEERCEERKRHEDEHTERVRDERVSTPEWTLGDDRARDDVAGGDQQCARRGDDDLVRARSSPDERIDHRNGNPDGEGLPGVSSVDADRLADELADRPLVRRKRGWQLAAGGRRSPRHGETLDATSGERPRRAGAG